MMSQNGKKTLLLPAQSIVWLLIIFIGIVYLGIQYNFTFIGDDLTFIKRWQELESERGWLAYPTFFYRHWLWSNARLADKINPLFFDVLPQWVLIVVNSVMISLLPVMMIKLSRINDREVGKHLMMLSLIVFTLPWWDSMLLNVCWLNYVWSAVFGLLAIKLFFTNDKSLCSRKLLRLLLFFFVAFSIGMHEAEGVPVMMGLTVYVMINHKWKHLSSCQKIIFIAAIVGSLYVISSPASWGRAASVNEISNKFSMIEIFLTSNYYTFILCSLMIVMSLKRKWRKKLLKMLQTEWVVFLVAAIVSAMFSVISGIIGRTGFFSQIFALIATFQLFRDVNFISKVRDRRIIALSLAVLIVTHYLFFYHYQSVAGSQLKRVIAKYEASTDGNVYVDYLRDDMMSWWTVNKVEGVPDADDVWIKHTISLFYGHEEKPLVILPAELENMNLNAIKLPVKIDGDVVAKEVPQIESYLTYEKLPLQCFKGVISQSGEQISFRPTNLGQEYVVTPFVKDEQKLFVVSERYIDWGD